MRKVLFLLALIICLCTCAQAVEVQGVEIHGFLQNRLYSVSGDPLFFQMERVSLSAKACLDNDIIAYVENYWHPAASGSGTYLESAYADMPFANGRLRLGKGRGLNFGIVPSYGNRKTSNYGIVAEAFTQDRITGLQYVQCVNGTDLGLTVENTPRVGTRVIGDPGTETPQVLNLADRDIPGDLNRNLTVTTRASRKLNTDLRVGASVSFGDLTGKDITDLNTLLGTAFTDNNRTRWAVDATYKKGNLLAQGEFIGAETSDLSHNGWYVLGGWEIPDGMRYYVRYGQVNMDITADPALTTTWDKAQTALSVVKPINKNAWLVLEQEWNSEKGGSADNDVTFLELWNTF
ncbi:MAG: hypothetical protein ACYC2Y_00185 [Armatimonadota bacterium]